MPDPHITDEMLAAEKRFFAARRGLEDAARRAGFEIQSIIGYEVSYSALRADGERMSQQKQKAR